MRVPAIIDDETFRRAQEQLQKNKRMSPRRLVGNNYLLRGLVRCVCCGRRMTGFRNGIYRYYRCTSVRDVWNTVSLEKCEQRCVPSQALDMFVWDHLHGLLTDPGVLEKELTLEREAAGSRGTGHANQESRLQRAIESQRRRLGRLLELYEEGLMEKDAYRERVDVLKGKQASLEQERERFHRQREDRERHARLLEGLDAFRSAVERGIDRATFEERQRLCRLVVESVDIEGEDVVVKHILPIQAFTAQ